MIIKKHLFTTPWHAPVMAYERDDTNDWNTLTSCLTEDEYELKWLPDRGIAIDIGAHIGGVSLALATKGYQVYAAEILPENIKMLKDNLELNHFTDKVVVIEKAITDKEGETIPAFYVDTNSETGSVHRFIGSVVDRGGGDPHLLNGAEVSVRTTTLEQIFKVYKIERCDFLKIDIEGGEWAALESTPKEILNKVARIAVEIESKDGKPTSTAEYHKLLGDDWDDVSETLFPLWCKPGNIVHGYFINKKLIPEI